MAMIGDGSILLDRERRQIPDYAAFLLHDHSLGIGIQDILS